MDFEIRNFYTTIEVLDKGYVQLIDGPRENPLLGIVNAARVSFNKQKHAISEKDIKLIKFLINHRHFSTLRHSHYTFRIKLPLSCARQMWKHQVGSYWEELGEESLGQPVDLVSTSYNEQSLRYVEVKPEFYIPDKLRKQSSDNKQGSYGEFTSEDFDGEDPVEFFKSACMANYSNYKKLVDNGCAKEQARNLLSTNIYTTCIWTLSLQAMVYFIDLRAAKDSQKETQEYAMAISHIMSNIFKSLGYDIIGEFS